MRAQQRLDDLQRAAFRRAVFLRQEVDHVRLPVTPAIQKTLSYAVIEAANLWDQYCRALYMSTAMRARDKSGARVVLGVNVGTQDDALTLAIHAVNPKLRSRTGPWSPRDEPDWQSTGQFRKVLGLLQPSNYADVDRALNYPTRVLKDLPTMRNFFAHKSKPSAEKARNLRRRYAITASVTPPELLCTVPPQWTQPIICSWLDDLREVIALTV